MQESAGEHRETIQAINKMHDDKGVKSKGHGMGSVWIQNERGHSSKLRTYHNNNAYQCHNKG